MFLRFFTLLFFLIFGAYTITDSLYAQRKYKRTPLEKRLFTRKNAAGAYTQGYRPSDTIAMDTIVIRYKRKDTTVRVYTYRGAVPALRASLGYIGRKHDAATLRVSAKTMQQIIDSPLHVVGLSPKDSAHYKVVSYLFSYRKKDVYLDDETMQVKTRYDFISYYVSESPLPEKRAKNIRNEILDGEDFWFEKIIVTNEKGERFFAPSIHIKTF